MKNLADKVSDILVQVTKTGKRTLNIECEFILFCAYLCRDKYAEQTNDKDYLQSLSLDGNWNRTA